MKETILAGSLSIDLTMTFDGEFQEHLLPDSLRAISLSVLIDTFQHTPGGIAGNIAYNLAMLGESPTIVGSVGRDGLEYIESLKKMGIDTSKIHTSELPTATFTVLADKNGNQIGGFYPGAMSDINNLSLKEWQEKDAFVVISAHNPRGMREHVRECIALGIPYMYDVSQQVSNIPGTDILEGFKGARIAIVNEYEREVASNKTSLSNDELASIVPILITTLAEKGSVIEGAEIPDPISIKPVTVNKVVEPTGAGDAYRAGLLYGITRDWPIETSAKLGSVTASFAIQHRGSQEHYFTLIEVAGLFRETFNHHLPGFWSADEKAKQIAQTNK